ncbi:hypothetical protein AALO_G00053620 [Alosa alosa]|uniref:Transposase Tc1-like domain-containing protein n=1 Tax=Alosa alosa TaxID=278164 RepID=A0AAV6H9Y1_9TELE|nr:hypothetical protein AALO_G00053620 [Alosa alosa]
MARKGELSSETRQSILVLRNEGCSMREIAKKLKISYNGVYCSLQRTAQTGSTENRTRSGRPRCTTKQEDKYIRVSSLRNRHLTGPQLADSLNVTRKTPVSTSTVKRRLRDADHLGRVANKKPYLRLANKTKRLRGAKEKNAGGRGGQRSPQLQECAGDPTTEDEQPQVQEAAEVHRIPEEESERGPTPKETVPL